MEFRSVAGAVSMGLLIAMTGGSAAARAFDLQCHDEHYRVDLQNKTWCTDKCEVLVSFHYRGGKTLFLQGMDHFMLSYDMKTKVMTLGYAGLGIEDKQDTPCHVMKFSGFPSDGQKEGSPK